MQKDKQEVLTQLSNNVSHSCELFGELLAVPTESVPVAIRNKALLRRLPICFISLYELLSEKSEIPKEYQGKGIEEIADYFIAKQMLPAEDKDTFVLLGSVYASIRWSEPGSAPDEGKIMEHVDALYTFIQRMVAYHVSPIISEKSPEATP